MTRITCAISGIQFQCAHFSNLNISHTEGYFHPIFAAKYSDLYKLYHTHSRGKLSTTDSYLLFLAFLHSSDQIIWDHPITLDPKDLRTKQIVENNIAQLIAVLEKTNLIQYGFFIQPSFRVTFNNSKLEEIQNWIKAWEDNIDNFKLDREYMRLKEQLTHIENKLSRHILSGDDPENFSGIVAEWADRAANFPSNKAELYRKTITSCFSITKMFNTPLVLLKEIKDYCECNIEAGSIHFHTLITVLKEGISRHIDYLGGSTLALGYTLLPKVASTDASYAKLDSLLKNIIASAGDKPPVKEDYTSSLDFLRARLAYKTAHSSTIQLEPINTELEDL